MRMPSYDTMAGDLRRTQEDIKLRRVRIEIFGLGYVGFPLSIKAALARFGVVGIDTNRGRIQRLSGGQLCDSEIKLRDAFLECRRGGRLALDFRSRPADGARVGIICVSTPPPRDGVDSNVHVADAVENFLDSANGGDIIIVESSVGVGTIDGIRDAIEGRGYGVGRNFGLAFCPERIDPQNKKWNLENIPRVIYCSDDATFAAAESLYHHINNANLVRVSSAKVAEVVKSFENAFRLVNISLVNELAILCDRLGISSAEVIGAAGTNPFGFMPFYPGAGAGGHCVPKDPRFLLESAKGLDVNFETISGAFRINACMPRYVFDAVDAVVAGGGLERTVLVCGLAYKPDIEDMRDSPGFKVVSEFAAAGYRTYAYDPYFDDALTEKYMVENSLTKKEFTVLPDLCDESLRGISCICVVQYHTKTGFRLEQIYRESKVALIYDCQKRMLFDPKSKTILRQLG